MMRPMLHVEARTMGMFMSEKCLAIIHILDIIKIIMYYIYKTIERGLVLLRWLLVILTRL